MKTTPSRTLPIAAACLVVSTAAWLGASAAAQTPWTKSAENPVLAQGPQAWESRHVLFPWVLKEGETYKMWYSGGTGSHTQIGYATSPDGIVWTKHAGNPVVTTQAAGPWASNRVAEPTVVKVDGLYRMWFDGFDCGTGTACFAIGLATSPDGINWTMHEDNPVLEATEPDEIAGGGVLEPTVVFEDGIYRMWYSIEGQGGIALATSTDGINWSKHAGNPILPRPFTSSTVLWHGGQYHMWYEHLAEIGYATSLDGVAWTEFAGNPVMTVTTPVQTFEEDQVGWPSVIGDGPLLKMWFSGREHPDGYRIGYATAPLVGGCPEPSDVDYQGFTAADCAVPQNSVVVFNQAELDAYLVDFGWDGSHVRNLNVKFNPSGEVVIVSPCEVNLAGEGGFLDIVAENICVYGRKGVTVAQDASNPDQGIAAETILLVSEEGNAGFSQGLTLTAQAITLEALKEAKVGLNSVVTVDGPLTLTSTGDLAASNAVIRQGSDVVAEEIVLSASRGATVGKNAVVSAVGDLCLESTGSAVKSVASIRQGAEVVAGTLKQTSGNKATVGKNATIEVGGNYEMSAGGSCSIAGSASITAGSTSGSCFE